MVRFIVALALCFTALTPAIARATDDKAEYTEVKAEAKVKPAKYEIIEQEFQNVTRPRVVVRITVDDANEKETGAAMAQALRDALDDEDKAKVASVFAYSEDDDTGSFYTRGVGEASTDGKGWTGDGKLSFGPLDSADDKKDRIFVLVGSALDDDEDVTLLSFPFKVEKEKK
jgi:hypothetical protein